MKGVLGIVIISSMFVGYVRNVVGLVKCDFEPVGKEEIVRTVGVFIPPIGMIVGYIDIDDSKSK